MTDLHEQMISIGRKAVAASHKLALLNAGKKNKILQAMADEIESRSSDIADANTLDMNAAAAADLSDAMLDRLKLDDTRIESMAHGLREVAMLKDPVGEEISRWIRPNGLDIVKVRVPIGVIGIIYESRPNVTADAAGLCAKTSNAVILRGGSDALHSNRIIAQVLQKGGARAGLPEHAVQSIDTPARDAIRELVQMEECVDLIIPRGGEGLIRAVVDQARVPVIKHYKGVCHTYVDSSADLQMALAIAENAKCQRPGVCNAMETLLVHEAVAAEFMPMISETLGANGVELRGDDATLKIVPTMNKADEADWYAEYLDLILAVKIVASIDEAIQHINHYGSRHSDAIVAADKPAQRKFLKEVDSATVYINTSTRFTDGGEFGMGAEMGISTDKLHARGPMGLEELTTYKYHIFGKGQVRE